MRCLFVAITLCTFYTQQINADEETHPLLEHADAISNLFYNIYIPSNYKDKATSIFKDQHNIISEMLSLTDVPLDGNAENQEIDNDEEDADMQQLNDEEYTQEDESNYEKQQQYDEDDLENHESAAAGDYDDNDKDDYDNGFSNEENEYTQEDESNYGNQQQYDEDDLENRESADVGRYDDEDGYANGFSNDENVNSYDREDNFADNTYDDGNNPYQQQENYDDGSNDYQQQDNYDDGSNYYQQQESSYDDGNSDAYQQQDNYDDGSNDYQQQDNYDDGSNDGYQQQESSYNDGNNAAYQQQESSYDDGNNDAYQQQESSYNSSNTLAPPPLNNSLEQRPQNSLSAEYLNNQSNDYNNNPNGASIPPINKSNNQIINSKTADYSAQNTTIESVASIPAENPKSRNKLIVNEHDEGSIQQLSTQASLQGTAALPPSPTVQKQFAIKTQTAKDKVVTSTNTKHIDATIAKNATTENIKPNKYNKEVNSENTADYEQDNIDNVTTEIQQVGTIQSEVVQDNLIKQNSNTHAGLPKILKQKFKNKPKYQDGNMLRSWEF